MLDPLAALGLLGNVLQIVSFLTEVIQQSRKVVQSGGDVLPSHEDLARLSERCHSSYQEIDAILKGGQPLNRAETLVVRKVEECTAETERLLDLLKNLAPKASRAGKASLVSALWKVTRAQSKVRDIRRQQEKIENGERQLMLNLLNLIRSVLGRFRRMILFRMPTDVM